MAAGSTTGKGGRDNNADDNRSPPPPSNRPPARMTRARRRGAVLRGAEGEKNANAAANDDDNEDDAAAADDNDDRRKRGATMVAAATVAARRRAAADWRRPGESPLFFLEIMNSEIGEARGEGKGGYCFLRRKGHVENQGENLPPNIEIYTHTFSKATAKLGKIRFRTSHIFGIRGDSFSPFFWRASFSRM